MSIADFKYKKTEDGGFRITAYKGKSVNVAIPSGVTEIGSAAFCWCNIETVVIPKSVKVIRSEAFAYCESLFEVDFEEGSELRIIESHAFIYCSSLKEIVLPEGLLSIGEFAFANCDSLRRAFIPSTVKVVEENAFEDRGAKFLISVDMKTLPSGFADKWNMLAEFELLGAPTPALTSPTPAPPSKRTQTPKPPSTPKPPKKAPPAAPKPPVSRCKPPATKKPEPPKQAPVTPEPSISAVDAERYSHMGFRVEETRYGRAITGVLNKELEVLTVPPEITVIGKEAFRDCTSLREVKGHSGLTLIDERAFLNCVNLSKADIPLSATVANYAFRGTALRHANINFSTYEGAFYESSVDTVSFNIKDGIPVDTVRPYILAKTNIESVDIPEGVDSIMTGAFANCLWLSDIKLPSSLVSLWNGAFSSCKSLREIKLPGGVSELPENCFAFCSVLEKINLENISVISAKALYCCNSLTTLTFSPKLRKLGEHAVASSSLKSIVFSGKSSEDYKFLDKADNWLECGVRKVELVFTDKTVYIDR